MYYSMHAESYYIMVLYHLPSHKIDRVLMYGLISCHSVKYPVIHMTRIVCNDRLIITFCTLLRSFGVLLWEIASYGQHPHGKIEPNDLIAAFEQEKAFLPKYVMGVLFCMSFHC